VVLYGWLFLSNPLSQRGGPGKLLMMKFVSTLSGHRLLLVWRTEFLFYTPERRQLAHEWNHVHLTSVSLPERPSLINHALDRPLPLPNESFDAIYSFHVIEHLSPAANERFMRDVHRLLKPGGIYRVSTPDLEFLATEYLQRLHEQMACASVENYARYRWAVCNLIDQCVREESGGEMIVALRKGEFTPEHVKHMNGDLLDFLFRPSPTAFPPGSGPVRLLRVDVVKRIVRKVAGPFIRRLRRRFRHKSSFELRHEKNLWLWDRVSLGRLFSDAGFRTVTSADHRTSSIPGWARYNFDESAYGEYPLEPSLYMEGTK
jgi:SAM-dependent methyltransferase